MSDELVAGVEAGLKGRYDVGAVESEVDFLCGAMSAAESLGFWPPPPHWIFSPISGDSIIEGQELKDTVEIELERCDFCNGAVPVSRSVRIGDQEWELKPEWGESAMLLDDGDNRLCEDCFSDEVNE